MEKQSPTEIEITKDGVKLHGVYEDFRPAVQTAVATVNHFFSVVENIVGLPAEFVNHHLAKFRTRYRERMEATPEEFRELPPLRVGCLVLREVAFAADEDDLQEMFANLLASASDRRTKEATHPSFATTINQLTKQDCQALAYLKASHYSRVRPYELMNDVFADDRDATALVIINLERLGLVKWEYEGPRGLWGSSESRRFASTFTSNSRSQVYRGEPTPNDLARGLERAAEGLYKEVREQLTKSLSPSTLALTEYGSLFVTACLPDAPGPTAPPE